MGESRVLLKDIFMGFVAEKQEFRINHGPVI